MHLNSETLISHTITIIGGTHETERGGGGLEKLYINIGYDTEDLNNQDVKDGCMKDVWCYSGRAGGEEYYTWRKRSIQVAKKISIEGF